MDEQIVARILVCLPPKSVYRFRAVSKSWNELISHPFFIERYDTERRRGGGLGLLFSFYEYKLPNIRCWGESPRESRVKYKIVPLNIPGHRRLECPSEEQNLGMFINYSNGLILCCGSRRHLYGDGGHLGMIHVLNPFKNKSVVIPLPPLLPFMNRYVTMGLMCEENKSELAAKYTIIRIDCEFHQPVKDCLRMVTYSSNTGLWAPSKPTVITTGDPRRVLATKSPLVMNGVFHWYSCFKSLTLALYRPGHEEVVHIRSYDGILNDYRASTALTRSSIDDGDTLWFGCMEHETMRVFMLQNCNEDGRSDVLSNQEWVLKYRISLGCFWKELLLLSSVGIFLEGLLPIKSKKAPVAIIRFQGHIHGMVFLYELDTASLQSVPYHGQPPTSKQRNGHKYIKKIPVNHPYLEAAPSNEFGGPGSKCKLKAPN